MNKNIIIGMLAIIILGAGAYIVSINGNSAVKSGVSSRPDPTPSITNFKECKDAGYPIMESYPEQCRAGEKIFINTVVAPKKAPPGTIVKLAEFNASVQLKTQQTIRFSDGLTATLNSIDDSWCPSGVQCFWQGELAAILSVQGGKIDATRDEVRIGTVLKKSINLKGYTFTLQSATENTATITVQAE